MNLVVISDIHGDVENLLAYLDKIKELNFDAIICPGDFTDVNTPKGFTQDDIARLIVSELKTLNIPVLTVPGNVDPKSIIELLEREDVSLHTHGKIIGDYGFYGSGGAKTPFETNIEPSEEETKKYLLAAYKDVEKAKYKIQITHAPPNGTILDMIRSGIHVGSDVVRKFIEEHDPILAISAHIHEARGVDKIKNTVIMNSGRFPEGYVGVVSIEDAIVDAKILNIIE